MSATLADVAANISGTRLVRHAVLTFSGTWSPPGFGFQSDVVNGLNQFVRDDLAEEVPMDYPSSFGFVNGGLTSPSYQQSVAKAVEVGGNWITDHQRRTFALGGYSQGAEAAARLAIELTTGSLQAYRENFIGGYAFGTPARMEGHGGPGLETPPGRGISVVNMTAANLPIINGVDCWADYNNPGDMYGTAPGTLPNGKPSQVGIDMTDVYAMATNLQLNDLPTFIHSMVNGLLKVMNDLGGVKALLGQAVLPAAMGGLGGDLVALMASIGAPALLGLFTQLISPGTEYHSGATGVEAATIAAGVGLQFLCRVPACAPHMGYEGGFGYPNSVAYAVGHLAHISTLTTARA